MKNILNNEENLEDLQLDGLQIIQNRNLYRFTSDAVVLSNFIKAKSHERLVDLGTGSGIIAILAAHKNSLSQVVGVEIQQDLALMAKRSMEINNLQNKITILNIDMQVLNNANTRKLYNLFDVDIVVANPPYKKGQTHVNISESARIARHEILINMRNLIKTANSLLKFGGRFYVVYDCVRLAELLFELKTLGLEPKRMFLTQPSENSEPILAFVEAVKGGKVGLRVLPNIVTNDKNGKYLEQVKKMRF